jgi:hypothetical protein
MNFNAIINQGNPATILARVGQNGSPIVQSSIAAIQVSVYNIDAGVSTSTTLPSVPDSIFDSYQLDPRWTTDSIGFNLAVDIDASAFDLGGCTYQVCITLQPFDGESFTIVGQVVANSVYSIGT